MNNTQLSHHHHKPSPHHYPVSILAHDVSDPLNIGSLFRLADAFSISALYLSGQTPSPPNHKIHKTARHTENSVPFHVIDDPLVLVEKLKKQKYLIISLEISTQSIAIQQLELNAHTPVCLIIGAENTGIEQSLLDISDFTVHIPMHGKNSSMNVSTATAIALYEITKQCNQVPPNQRLLVKSIL